jgi:predicted transcriptional regulator
MTTRDDIAFLVGSDSRVEILRELVADDHRPTELASEVSCARETMHRTLSGFVDRKWVEQEERRYRATPVGEMVMDRYEQLEATVKDAHEYGTFLTEVGDPATELPREALREAKVTTATAENPHAPIDRYVSWLGSRPVSRFRGMSPIVSPVFNEAAERVIGPETEMELVVDASVLDTSEREYPEAFEQALSLDQFTLLLSPEPVEFGFALVDGEVAVSACDDGGNVVALVDGDNDALYRWATDVYERRKEDANPVTERTL